MQFPGKMQDAIHLVNSKAAPLTGISESEVHPKPGHTALTTLLQGGPSSLRVDVVDDPVRPYTTSLRQILQATGTPCRAHVTSDSRKPYDTRDT
jgi:hypothetical protein